MYLKNTSFLSLLILVLAISSCADITYNVDIDGDGILDTAVLRVDDTPGPTQDFRTIQAAVDKARPGVEIWVYKGNYDGFRVHKAGTTPSKRITIKAVEPGVVINNREPRGSKDSIHIRRTSYVTIEAFTIERHGMKGFGIAARGAKATFPMRGLIIRNNIVRESGKTNIYLSQVADSLIEGNTTYGAHIEHGIYLANGGSDNNILRANIIYGNKRGGIHLNGDLSVGGDGLQTDIIIENNII